MNISSTKLGLVCLILVLAACGNPKEGQNASTEQATTQETQSAVLTPPTPAIQSVIKPGIETEEQRIQRAMEIHKKVAGIGKDIAPLVSKHNVMLDLSNPSVESNVQMIEHSKTPVIASYPSIDASSQEAVRGLSDEELLAVKKNGGVVQLIAIPGYLNKDKDAAYQGVLNKLYTEIAATLDFAIKSRQELNQLDKLDRAIYDNKWAKVRAQAQPRLDAEVYAVAKPVDVTDFANQLDYLVKLIGIDNVGICPNFHGGEGISGWSSDEESHNITIELVRRGYTEEQLAQLWGGNAHRVLNEAQKIAGEPQTAKES